MRNVNVFAFHGEIFAVGIQSIVERSGNGCLQYGGHALEVRELMELIFGREAERKSTPVVIIDPMANDFDIKALVGRGVMVLTWLYPRGNMARGPELTSMGV